MNFIEIKNKNHRLGNDDLYFYHPELIEILQHKNSKDCWCEPVLDYEDPETGNQVWVYRTIE